MTKLKKSLSVLLSLVMLFTTLCFFVLPETGIKANAAAGAAVSVAGNANAYNRVDDVIITVPETIYMTPSTGATKSGQYYVNNIVDENGNVTLESNRAKTTGIISIYAPGATHFEFNVTAAVGNYGEPVIGGSSTDAGSSFEQKWAFSDIDANRPKDYMYFDGLQLYLDGTGMSAGDVAGIKWTITLTFSDGHTATYYAFSTLYAPFVAPVGAAIEAEAGGSTWLGSILWVDGVHSSSTSSYTGAAHWYPRTDNFIPMAGAFMNSGFNNNQAKTYWIQEASNGMSDSITWLHGAHSNKNHTRVNVVSPVANITVDTSRYSNFNQIPNFKIGYMITDSQETESGGYYIADYTGYNYQGSKDGYDLGSYSSAGSEEDRREEYYNASRGTEISSANNKDCAVKYHNVWNRAIETGTLTIKAAAKGINPSNISQWTRYTVWNNSFVQINVTGVSKIDLRNLVLQGTSINENNYSQGFGWYIQGLENAAYVLGNPCATQEDVNKAVARIKTTITGGTDSDLGTVTGLEILVPVYANHSATDTNKAEYVVKIGTNVSADVSLSTPAQRVGYDFLGWSSDRNAASGDKESPVTVSLYDKNLYEIWTIKKYTMTFNTNGGTAIAPITQNYNTQISAPANPTKEGHTFAGWDITFPYTLLGDVTANAKWTVNKYTITFDSKGGSSVSSITEDYGTAITAPADPTKTGYEFKGWSPALPETMPAKNYPVSAIWEAKDYTITYDLNDSDVIDAVLGEKVTSYTIEDTITLPTVTSANYNFVGWEVTSLENGNWVTKLYNAGEEVSGVYGDITLRAKWDIKKFTVNWESWSGIIETDIVNYGEKPSFNQSSFPTKPADAQYTYTFRGWDKDTNIPVTEDITFKAQFESTLNSYTVIWYDSNGTILEEKTYLYGDTPSYSGAQPSKTDPSGKYTYTFTGWSPAIGIVEGNTSYTAQYTEEINTYTVTFTYRDKDGNEKTVTIDNVAHGTAFSTLVPSDCVEYYNGVSTGFNHSHYRRTWNKTVDAITEKADFVAEYELLDNVTMSFTDAYKDSDCENTGLNSRECTRCGYKHEEEIPAKGHAWSKVSDSATCLTAGTITYTCSRCGGTKEEDSPAKGHSFTVASAEIPATCITDGWTSYKNCVVCGLFFGKDEDAMSVYGKTDTTSFKVEAQGHKFTLTEMTPATCEEDGHEAYNTCSVCNLYFAADADIKAEGGAEDLTAFTITKLGHDYKAEVTAPTCTEEGFTTYTCKNDSTHTYVSDYVDAKGHTPGTPVVENRTNATCTVAGTYDLVVYCTVKNCCDDIPAGKEYFEISRETKTDFVPHDYIDIIVEGLEGQLKAEKTCYSYAEYYKVCSMCRTEMSTETFFYVDGGKLEHTPAAAVIENKTTATCTEPAEWDEVVYCSVEACKHKISSTHKEGETNPENHADHKTTTTISNEKPGTCVSERTWTETVTCNGCKEVISVTNKVGNKNVLNHVAESEGEAYIDTPGTCISETVWRVDTTCSACGDKTKTRTYKGEKNPDKHTGGTDVKIENSVEGTCITPNTWQVVTYCLGCGEELSRIDKEGSLAPDNHTADTYTKEENIVEGTCTTEKTWDIVTYCSDCNKAVSTEHKTGEKNPENHSGATELRNNKAATCGEEGYTGDLYWDCCNKLEKKGEILPIVAEHSPGEPVRENEIPATETTDGEFDSVVYCSVCGHELSREHVIHKIERTIRFVLKDKVVEVKAFSGDTVEAPETPEVQTEDGFWHYFISWDKRIKPVTGDATYTAIYTEPCDYSELESLEAQLKEILEDGTVDDATIEANKAEIEATLAEIKRVYMDRNYRDVSEQNEITEVTDRIESLIQVICPDLGATLVIEGSVVQYTGRTLALRAVKMPSGVEVFDAEWTSSDDSIAFFANGKLYAIGTGSVTVTAKRGSLTATKTVTIVEGGNTRGINFTSVDNTSFILEDTYQTKDGAIVFWSDDQPIRFRVHLSPSFLYEKYFVYINGEAAEMDMDGYYTIPANSGDVKITIAGEMIDTGAGQGPTVNKWSFWDWLLSFFKKIGDFFRGLFS
ncbi:MAG: InlB B-repeat-containing protein [Clostridia bacterium]|nr:InlB B-repeat-containing protein [Clostridia bacterium]